MSDPQYFTQKQLEKLSEDPRNRVYQYTYDNPTQTYTSQEQSEYLTAIRNRYQSLRREHPDQNDDQLREKILEENETWRTFAENHEKIFNTFTDRSSSPEHLNHIGYMLYIKKKQEEGLLDPHQAHQMIQSYLAEQFKTGMTLNEYKDQLKRNRQ